MTKHRPRPVLQGQRYLRQRFPSTPALPQFATLRSAIQDLLAHPTPPDTTVVQVLLSPVECTIRFYRDVFGFVETACPVGVYAVLRKGESTIGLIEKAAGTKPAEGSDDLRRYERHWTPVHVDFRVDDLERTLKRALSAGAKTEKKFAGGDHPPIAFCSDPFGNGFCVLGRVQTPLT